MRRLLKFSIALPAINESMNESKHKKLKEQINMKIKILPAMNESMNESIHKSIKEQINIKIKKDLPITALFISLKKYFSKSFFPDVGEC